MKNKRLKLYDTKLELFLEHKEKEIMRKNAYRNKMTMSDYVRKLIILDNKFNNINEYNKKILSSNNEIKLLKNKLGKDF